MLFTHLQIYDPAERRLVAAADVGLAVLERIAGVGRRSRGDGSARRILLLRLERIGDLLMAVPAIRAVRALAPASQIDLAVGSWNASLAAAIPGIDRIETVDAPWLARGAASSGALLQRARAWRQRRYDLAINFEGDIRSHVLMRLSGATRRIGFDMAGGGPVLTDRVAFDPTVHTAVNAIRLVAHAFGAPAAALADEWLAASRGGRPRIDIPAAARERATALLASARRPLIGVQAGGGRAIKQWPPERFGAVAAAVARAHDATIVLTGAASDRLLIDEARRALPPSARVIDVSTVTDLLDVAAIVERLDLLITGDTGPMHVADAVGTPVVAIFGLTTPVRWGPLSHRSRVVRIDLPCSPCNRVRRPPERCVGIVPDCLSGIGPEAVIAAASDALAGVIPLHRP
jgi:lipopolysaccharide heptosyltransferase II